MKPKVDQARPAQPSTLSPTSATTLSPMLPAVSAPASTASAAALSTSPAAAPGPSSPFNPSTSVSVAAPKVSSAVERPSSRPWVVSPAAWAASPPPSSAAVSSTPSSMGSLRSGSVPYGTSAFRSAAASASSVPPVTESGENGTGRPRIAAQARWKGANTAALTVSLVFLTASTAAVQSAAFSQIALARPVGVHASLRVTT